MGSFCWLVTPPSDRQSEKTRENSVDNSVDGKNQEDSENLCAK